MEKRFVSIWLPQLETDWCSRQDPALATIPFVISAPVHGRMVITAANPLATSKGIYPGMVLADARAIHPSLKSLDAKPGLQEKLLNRIAAWCIRFSPVAAIDLPSGLIIDASGCTHLWGSEQEYLGDILQRLKEKGFIARAGIAGTIGCAWAVARYGTSLIVPPGKQADAMLQLPPASLRLSPEILERLQKLGLQRVRDFISMPRTALRRRFGQSILDRLDEATGNKEEFIQPVHSLASYFERLPCLEPVARREGIEHALQELLDRLCKRLQQEGKGARSLKFRCFRIDGKEQELDVGTSAPSRNAKHLFHLFELKIDTIEPVLGIELFLLEAGRVEDHKPVQAEYWKSGGGLKDEGLARLIDRISGKLGEGVVSRYLPAEHYWPERSYKKAGSLQEQPQCNWKTDRPRPLILLPKPERIEVTAPIPDYPPMLFRYKNKLHKITRADGPERIEQEWWLQQGEHRDYYAVEDEEGCRYWLFRSGHYNAEKTYSWYLHGYFT